MSPFEDETTMSSLEQQQQQQQQLNQMESVMLEENCTNQEPFNQYNTEFVKLDANQWLDDATDASKMVHLDGLQFGLLSKSERQAELFAKLAPDSVNVILREYFWQENDQFSPLIQN